MSNVVPFTIEPSELRHRQASAHPLFILDVREPEEFALANLGGMLIPLQSLAQRLAELGDARRHEEFVVLCHHGIRSAHATQFLRQQGFALARNLSGGIDRWSCEVDPTIPRY